MATIRGTSKRDVLRDKNTSNTLLGLAGNDDLYGNGGNDTLKGGTGTDKLFGGLGNDKLFGEAGNDTLDGGTGNDVLDGGLGNDKMKGGTGNDTFIVNSAADVTTDTSGIDLVKSSVTRTLGLGLENLLLTGVGAINGTGNAGNNIITGNAAANTLDGAGGTDTLNGLGGNDTLVVGTGTSTYNGGDGTGDILSLRNGTAGPGDLVLILPPTGGDTAWDLTSVGLGIATYSGIEGFEGRDVAGVRDIFNGNAGNNILRGLAGDDLLEGFGGDDTLEGGAGSDTLTYYNSATGVTVTLGAGGSGTANVTAAGLGTDTYTSIENLDGSFIGNDVLTGNEGDNAINGLGGADTLDGGVGGADTLNGDAGDDILKLNGAATSTDTLNGGADNDTLSLENAGNGAFGGSTLFFTLGTGGNGSFNGLGFNVDSATYSSIENVIGRNNATFGDNLTGNTGNNVLNGLAGNDTLNGLSGVDTLNGGDGDDVLRPGYDGAGDTVDGGNGTGDWGSYSETVSGVVAALSAGFVGSEDSFVNVENLRGSAQADLLSGDGIANIIEGGGSGDTLTGNGGADIFRYIVSTDSTTADTDLVSDFSRAAGDKLDIANLVLESANGLNWIDDAAFSGGEGEIRWEALGSGAVRVQGDLNGGGIDFEVIVQGTNVFFLSDFTGGF